VILHGWNMVYKVGSYRPEDAGFGDDDARFLAENGFNTVRLGVIYKGVEATPGVYDDAYLESIERTEGILAAHGIFSLLDFHQDMYNERFQGEGFPDWAVVGDAATLPAEPRLGFPANYLGMPALNRAYDNFWLNDLATDGRTLQDAYAAAWRHVAGRFADDPHVLGYNLFNEPWPGSQYPSCTSNVGCPVFDQQFLQPFSERVIAAIRQADPNTLAWYAPLLTFDFGADTSHGDTGDAHAGFAFNMYCLAELGGAVADLGPATGPECDTGYGLTLDNAEQQSLETGDALLMTEFAATDDLSIIKRVVELADERMISWQQWHYCGCDDPTTSGPGIQALVGDAAQPPTGTNVNDQKLLVSSRPYPQAVAGTPQNFGFDDATGVPPRLFDRARRRIGQLPSRIANGDLCSTAPLPGRLCRRRPGCSGHLSTWRFAADTRVVRDRPGDGASHEHRRALAELPGRPLAHQLGRARPHPRRSKPHLHTDGDEQRSGQSSERDGQGPPAQDPPVRVRRRARREMV
jgi:endoglycosylceramidase